MPTENQQKAFNKTMEKLGNDEKVDMGDILKESGYSDAVVKNPKVVTESKGWQELMDSYLPDELLAKKNNWLLRNKNWQAVNAGLDKAYKIKGKYKETIEHTGSLTLTQKLNDNQKADNTIGVSDN